MTDRDTAVVVRALQLAVARDEAGRLHFRTCRAILRAGATCSTPATCQAFRDALSAIADNKESQPIPEPRA